MVYTNHFNNGANTQIKRHSLLNKKNKQKKAKAKNSTGAVTALERQVYCTGTQ